MMALELLFHNGDVQTVPPGYVLNPATDREVRTHNGIDYSSRNSPAWGGGC
jgi:hypothetical protein